MMQRFLLIPSIFFALLTFACEEHASSPATRASAGVASLVPAATNIICAMRQQHQLVAVSNWEPPAVLESLHLPTVGDYRTIDWEKLTRLRPRWMIVQWSAQKAPGGVQEEADRVGCRMVNVTINRLEDIFTTIDRLGIELDASTDARRLHESIQARLDQVSDRAKSRPKIRTLILHSESSLSAVGRHTYLDDVLQIAGGENVIQTQRDYPTLNAEQLLVLRPDVILQLLPAASPQVIDKAKAFWTSFPEIPAVKNQRVWIISDDDILLPAANIASVAERFADKLQGPLNSGATTAPAGVRP